VPINKGDDLPNLHHVLRYIGKKHVDNNFINGSAFLATPSDMTPSVNWMEHFPPPTANQVDNIVQRRRLKYERRGKLASLHIDRTKAYLIANSQPQIDLKFIYDPLPPEDPHPEDLSHSYMTGLPLRGSPEEEATADLLVHCIVETFSVTPD
jgi:hypothetical protein